MKILWHMPTLQTSCCGLSRRAIELAKQLSQVGHDIEFAVSADKTDVNNGNIDGLPVRLLNASKNRPLHWSLQARSRMNSAMLAAEKLRGREELFISCQPEMVHAYARLKPRAPVVFICGGTTLLHEQAECGDQRRMLAPRQWPFALDRSLRRRNEKAAFRSADAVIFDSHATRALVVNEFGLEPGKCHTVHGGVDPETFAPASMERREMARQKLGLKLDDQVVVWTGRFSPEKNVAILIRAFAQCRSPRCRLLLVGEGPLGVSLQQLVTQLQCNRHIIFCGAVQDVRPYLHAADIFAFPSRGESFGGSLIEAMACGLHCVALRPNGLDICTATNEIIKHGTNGWLVNQNEPAEFAMAMDQLLSLDSLRVRLGQSARQTAEANFTWQCGGRRLDEILRALCGAETPQLHSNHSSERGLSCALASI